MALNLTKSEIFEVTGKIRPTAQIRVLNQMKIPAKLRADNVVLVSRDAYQVAMGVEKSHDRLQTSIEPDYSQL